MTEAADPANRSKHSSRLVRMRARKAGLPPGSVIHTGEQKVDSVRVTVFDYDATECRESVTTRVEDVLHYRDTPTVTWINIDGLHDVSLIETLGQHYVLHPLIQEDIVSTAQRPKLEDLESYLYIVLRLLHCEESVLQVHTEQISLVLGENFVISFQESVGDVFDPVRDRIRHSRGKIRKMGPDYLVYALLDAVVDSYFILLEGLGDEIESLEEKLIANPTQTTLTQIHRLRHEMIFLRKSVWPLREMTGDLERAESPLIDAEVTPYLRDVYDHTLQAIDTLETYRDMVSGMLDTYLSCMSNRMNGVMQVLTIMATTFIPLTFVVGIYGMNFERMPELKWKYGYLGVWIVMFVILAGLVTYFRRQKWL